MHCPTRDLMVNLSIAKCLEISRHLVDMPGFKRGTLESSDIEKESMIFFLSILSNQTHIWIHLQRCTHDLPPYIVDEWRAIPRVLVVTNLYATGVNSTIGPSLCAIKLS